MSYPRFFAQQGERLIDNGYPIIPIRPGAKNPSIDAWQSAQLTKEQVRTMGANGHAVDGVGILTAWTPAVDIDVYDERAALAMSDWIDRYIGLGLIRQGAAPKQLMVFRTDTPFSKTFSAEFLIPGTSKPSKIEILGNGQQFVAYGIHPETQQPYLWPDETVLERPRHTLPALDQEQARQICKAFEDMCTAAGWPRGREGNWTGVRAVAVSGGDPLDRKLPREDVSDEQVREALSLLDANEYSEYGNWVRVGQMLHHQYQGTQTGLEIYDEWSQTLDKYEGYDAVEAKWSSFDDQRNAGTVTIGSLLHEVKQIRASEAAKEEEIRKGMEAFLFREIETEIREFTGDWFDFKASQTVTNIKRFLSNVTDLADAERYLSKAGKTVIDRQLDGAPAKSTVERELKPAYRKAGAAPQTAGQSLTAVTGPIAYETNRDGAIVPTQGNVNLAMKAGGYAHFAFDAFQASILVNICGTNDWRLLEDNDYPRALVFLETQGFAGVAKEKIKDAIAVVADEHRFDSAIQWGNSLMWDGVERLRTFPSVYLKLPDTPYHVAVWYYAFTAMASRLLNPGEKCDMVPVLVSEEGMRKSTFVSALAPIHESFGHLDLSRKEDDVSRCMRGKLVMEWGEMKGLKGRDEEAVKQFVTQTFQEWTPKYKEQQIRFMRRCFFIGTANTPDLLPAQGKNRRWLPQTLTQDIDVDAVLRDRDQLWAEAIAVYRAYGVQWQAAHDLAGAERESYREDDPLTEFIAAYLDSASFEGGTDGTARRGDGDFKISEVIAALENAGRKQITVSKVGNKLRALGYESLNVRTGHFVSKLWRRKR